MATNVWEVAKSASTVLSAVALPIVLAFVGNSVTSAVKEREIQGKFVELAVQILREQPSKQETGLREWATQVLNQFSGVPFSSETKKALIESTPLPSASTTRSPSAGRGYLMISSPDSYSRYSKLLGIDLVSNPEQAANPSVAAKIFALHTKVKEQELKTSLATDTATAVRRRFVRGMTGGDRVHERYKAYRSALEQAPANAKSLDVPGIRRKSWLDADVPLILAALQEQGITDKDVLAYALATAEFETAQGAAMVEIGK